MSEVKTNKISSVSTNGDITLDPDGTGKVSISGALHIDSGSDNANTLLLSDGAADNNIVDGFVTCRHHSSSEEPVLMIQGRSTSSENIVLVGGTHNNSTYNTATSIKFFTASGYTNTTPVEKMRVTGDGLTFNGDTAAANALDDYEEGDFTPQIWEGTSAISDAAYNTSFTKGTYIKIGRMVMITMSLRLTSKGTPTGSSNFRIGGFPFTTTNDVKARSSFATYDHDATGIDTTGDTTGTLHAFISNGVNYLGFRVSDPSKAAAETLNYDDLGNDTYLQLTGTIVVD